jgi:hypothetical protein
LSASAPQKPEMDVPRELVVVESTAGQKEAAELARAK